MIPWAATLGDFAAPSGAWWVVCGPAIAGLAALFLHRPRLKGTTLIAPWFWSLVALASLGGSELAIGLSGTGVPEWSAQLRFAAAMSTFCPMMALLGAKRPQNRGWQVIVFSLWAILCLPSIEWLLFGGMSEIHPARFWFLAILIAIGTLNTLPTRYWPSSLLYCAGQVALLAPFFSAQPALSASQAPLVGTAALVLAWWLITAQFPRSKSAAPLDCVWLDFRDAFGVVWALRVAERINASARMYDWPVKLTWRGFRPSATAGLSGSAAVGAISAIPAPVEDSLRTLLRRFVSGEWIDARLGQPAAPTASTA